MRVIAPLSVTTASFNHHVFQALRWLLFCFIVATFELQLEESDKCGPSILNTSFDHG